MKLTQKNFIVTSKEGKPTWATEHQKALFYDFFTKHDGKKIWLTLDPKMPVRTERQNRYLWLYYSVIADEKGGEPIDIHEFAKQHCMPVTEKEMFGKKTKIYRSTRTLEKIDEFSKYLNKIQELTGVPMPDTTGFDLPMTHEEYDDRRRSYTPVLKEKVIN